MPDNLPAAPAPVNVRTLADAATGEVMLNPLTHPETGEVTGGMILSDASDLDLAAWKDAATETLRRAAEAVALVDRTLSERFDKTGKWTHYVGPFKVTAKSPNPTYTYDDPEKLRRALLRLVDKGALTLEAVDAACPIVPERVTAAVGPLANLMKVPAAAATIKRHRKVVPVGKRSVRVEYMGTRRG